MKKRILSLVIIATLGTLAHAGLFDNPGSLMGATGDIIKAASISDKQVAEIATQYAAYSDKKNKLAEANNAYSKRLDKLTQKHQTEDGLKLTFKVYLAPTINAFALADGNVRVYSGLMDLMTDEELLGVIGHEIGHVKNGDHRERMKTAYMTSAVRKAATADSGKMGALADSELGGIAEKIVNAQFSQSQETAADDYGLSFLKRNNYNAKAMESALRKLADLNKKNGATSSAASLFSSHPDSASRADRIKNQLESATATASAQ